LAIFWAANIIILLGFGLLILKFRVISPFVLIAGAAYIPSLAFFCSYVLGGQYVNYQNYHLQNNEELILSSVSLYMTSFLIYTSLIFFSPRYRYKQVFRHNYTSLFWRTSYFISTLIFVYFYWLMDAGMGFENVFNSTYSQVLERREEGARFSAIFGQWFFSISLFLFIVSRKCKVKYNFVDLVFIFATFSSAALMLMHASRMPLLGMGITFLIGLLYIGVRLRHLVVAASFFIALWWIGGIRELGETSSWLDYLSFNMLTETSESGVVALPGGASNVMMSFIITVDYFDKNDLFFGKTFTNYLLQLLPSDLYIRFDISTPEYYEKSGVFDNYDWNGGINTISVFYANFGFIGVLLHGLYVSLLAIVASYALTRKSLGGFVLGAFIIGYSVPSFFYEPIQLIKPLLYLGGCLIFSKVLFGLKGY